jgi:hypothetical protein
MIMDKIEPNYCSKLIDDYYEELNRPVNYDFQVDQSKKKYLLFNYKELQELSNTAEIVVYKSVMLSKNLFYWWYEHVVSDHLIPYFMSKIRPWKKYLRFKE